MASIIRCDECKKLNDEQGVGYVGKYWTIKSSPRMIDMTIKTYKDLCRECAKKLFNSYSLAPAEDQDD